MILAVSNMLKENKSIIISGYHLNEIMDKIKKGIAKGIVSLDLGISKSEFVINGDTVSFPEYDTYLSLETIKKLLKKRSLNDCFLLEDDNNPIWIYSFSDKYGVVKLYEPKIDWPPTLFINGSFMHTISVSKPTQEAFEKANTLKGISGDVLETGFGLGYSTIWLKKLGVKRIVACEISSDVIDIAKLNPWSKDAFIDKSISIRIVNVAEFVETLPSSSFDGILHDPPNFNKFEYLYSASFYNELYRILKPKGKIYHFIGTKNTENAGIYKNVTKKLYASGFNKVVYSYRGIIAIK
ncbi:MAG: methyltransferase domain-containing protein [Caldisphaera sp.]